MPRNVGCSGWGVIAGLGIALSGCGGGRALVATPNFLCREAPHHYFSDSSRSDIEVVYATDRSVAQMRTIASYGSGRSKRLVFGTATVELAPQASWRELLADSTSRLRKHNYLLRAGACQEVGSFETFGGAPCMGPDGLEPAPATTRDEAGPRDRLYALLHERLACSAQKDVFVYVHGYNNSFADAVYRTGELWHFLGRVGVPVAYTWPAGHGGPLGYLYDRESGEFTIFHLKQFLARLAACPDVERVHVIAHSRGTDVAISALRELHIAYQAQGRSTRDELKLENLVLAAPDLDEDVFVQRFIAEGLLSAARRTTIYTSPTDRAIEIADYAFASKKRVGNLSPSDFSPHVRQVLARLPQLQYVECRVTHFSTSHDYVFAHPAALSDLIMVLRERRPPGAEHGRPLIQTVAGVWELDNDYLLHAPPRTETK